MIKTISKNDLETCICRVRNAGDKERPDDKYNEGDIFESEADLLIDFSESNPFGSF